MKHLYDREEGMLLGIPLALVQRTDAERPQLIMKHLIPDQRIIEMMKSKILSQHPMEDRESVQYDLKISQTFSESFANASVKFAQNLKKMGDKECILVDRFGKIQPSFLRIVIAWTNIVRTDREEFHDCLLDCMLEQFADPAMITESIGIGIFKEKLILFSSDPSVDTVSRVVERRRDGAHRVLG